MTTTPDVPARGARFPAKAASERRPLVVTPQLSIAARVKRALTPFTFTAADIELGSIDIEGDLHYGRD
jgi:hypothetical protein